MALAIARPSPTPRLSAELACQKRSKILSRLSGGIPGPESTMEKQTVSCLACRCDADAALGGVNFTALTIRLDRRAECVRSHEHRQNPASHSGLNESPAPSKMLRHFESVFNERLRAQRFRINGYLARFHFSRLERSSIGIHQSAEACSAGSISPFSFAPVLLRPTAYPFDEVSTAFRKSCATTARLPRGARRFLLLSGFASALRQRLRATIDFA